MFPHTFTPISRTIITFSDCIIVTPISRTKIAFSYCIIAYPCFHFHIRSVALFCTLISPTCFFPFSFFSIGSVKGQERLARLVNRADGEVRFLEQKDKCMPLTGVCQGSYAYPPHFTPLHHSYLLTSTYHQVYRSFPHPLPFTPLLPFLPLTPFVHTNYVHVFFTFLTLAFSPPDCGFARTARWSSPRFCRRTRASMCVTPPTRPAAAAPRRPSSTCWVRKGDGGAQMELKDSIDGIS